MFIFLLTPFDTWGCYYFGSNLSLMLLMKVLLIKKHLTLFFSLLTWRINFATFIFVFVRYVIGEILSKNCCQMGIGGRGWQYIWGCVWKRVQSFYIIWLHYELNHIVSDIRICFLSILELHSRQKLFFQNALLL